jgi:hypothetical protein
MVDRKLNTQNSQQQGTNGALTTPKPIAVWAEQHASRAGTAGWRY